MHARFSDHAGSAERSRWRARPCCLPLHRQRRHPGSVFFRGSMAGLHVPLPTLRRHPRGCLRTARGRCGSLLLHRQWTCTTYSLPVSRRTDVSMPMRIIWSTGGLLCLSPHDLILAQRCRKGPFTPTQNLMRFVGPGETAP